MSTLLGADRADVTPQWPVPLAGYAARATLPPASQVLAPLHLRTLVLGGDGDPPVILVAADLLWWGDELVAELRREVGERFGAPPQNLVLHATHTHSGPQTARHMAASLGLPDENYLDALRRSTVRSIEAAWERRRPVHVQIARTSAQAGVDRRWARSAGTLPRTPIDQDLTIVQFVEPDGSSAALLVHYSCHPVVHHGNAITSDFSGELSTGLEATTAPVVMFLQGCCGDVNPDRYEPDGSYRDGDQADVEAMGQHLAGLVRSALPQARPSPAAVGLRRSRVSLPLQPRLGSAELLRVAETDGLCGEWARLMREQPHRFKREPHLDLVRVDLARDLHLLGMPAEPVSRFGLHAKKVSGNRCLAMGYTDGMTTYLVTPDQYAEGGYEPHQAPFYLGMPAALQPTSQEPILAAITALASNE